MGDVFYNSQPRRFAYALPGTAAWPLFLGLLVPSTAVEPRRGDARNADLEFEGR